MCLKTYWICISISRVCCSGRHQLAVFNYRHLKEGQHAIKLRLYCFIVTKHAIMNQVSTFLRRARLDLTPRYNYKIVTVFICLPASFTPTIKRGLWLVENNHVHGISPIRLVGVPSLQDLISFQVGWEMIQDRSGSHSLIYTLVIHLPAHQI
jgi:hypothetical protein